MVLGGSLHWIFHIVQIKRIERLPVPVRQPIQYFPLLLHSENVFTKIRNYLTYMQAGRIN